MSLLKIKLKLLIKSLRKRKPESSEKSVALCYKGKGWSKTKNFLSQHIGSVFSEAYGNDSQEILGIAQEGEHVRFDHPAKERSVELGRQKVGHLRIAPDDQELLGGRGKDSADKSLQQSAHAGDWGRSKELARISRSKRSSSQRKRTSARFTLRKAIQQGTESESEENDEEDSRRFELCRKKILMGGKCRALSKSGMLHYDENGVLLPELP